MKGRLILANILLVAGIGGVIWHITSGWKEASAQRKANLNVPARKITSAPPGAAPRPESPTSTQYAQVAEKNLFSSDRNPTVVVEAIKVEPPKPMPPLPVVFGVMGLPSGIQAIMAERSGGQSRSIRTGDSIGEFKVLSLNNQTVKFEWDGKEVERKIEDLADRGSAQGNQTNSGPAAPPPPQVSQGPAAPPPAPANSPLDEQVGIELTPGVHACKNNTPTTAIVNGLHKVLTPSPFGTVCRWTK